MYIYIILWIYSILISRILISNELDNRNTLKIKKLKFRYNHKSFKSLVGLFLLILPCTAVSAFRYGIGTDYFYTYVPSFNRIVSGEHVYTEWGFELLNIGISKLTSNAQALIAVVAFLTIVLMFTIFYVKSKDFLLSIVLFFATQFYFVSLNNCRQCLAFPLVLIGIYCWNDKKFVKSAIFLILATSIHISSIVYLMIIFGKLFNKVRPSIYIIIIGLVLLLKGVIYRSSIFSAIVANTVLADYIKYGVYTGSTIPRFTLFFNLLLFLIFLCILRFKKEYDFLEGFYLFLQVCALIVCFFDGLIPGAYRILRLFSFAQIVSIPYFTDEIKNTKYRILVRSVIILFMIGICVLEIFIRHNEAIIPYVSIWNQ